MSMEKFQPEQFKKLTGKFQIETELRRWLRSIPLSERVDFVNRLWDINYRFAISLVRSSQIPVGEVISLLKCWLSLGQHNTARGLVEGLVPVLGEERFWKVATQAELAPAMEEFLSYHSRGLLARYKMVNNSFKADGVPPEL